MYRSTILALLLFSTAATAQDIPYASVDEAMEDLASQPGAVVEEQDGWTVITFEESKDSQVLWTFVPEHHYAYPAMARRQMILEGQTWDVDTTLMCGGSEASCVQLQQDFENLDLRIREQLNAEFDNNPPE